MPNLFTTSDHENPLFVYLSSRLELSPNRAGLPLPIFVPIYVQQFAPFLTVSSLFTSKTSAKLAIFLFFFPTLGFSFSRSARRFRRFPPHDFYRRCERVHFVLLFPFSCLCVLVASGGGKPVETVEDEEKKKTSRDT